MNFAYQSEMSIILSQLGVEEFIHRARDIGITVLQPRFGGSSGRGITISFDVFIWIISKFVIDNINLDASIEQSGPSSGLPQIYVWGTRDPGIRKNQGPRYLRGHQQGAWSYFLLDALRYGIPSEHIQMFRENLNLSDEYDINDDLFFQIPTVPFK